MRNDRSGATLVSGLNLDVQPGIAILVEKLVESIDQTLAEMYH